MHVLNEAIEDRRQAVLDQDEDAEEQRLLDRELEAAGEPTGHERALDGGDPTKSRTWSRQMGQTGMRNSRNPVAMRQKRQRQG